MGFQLACSDASSEMNSRVYTAVSENPAPVTATVVACPMNAPGGEAEAQLDGEKEKYIPRPCNNHTALLRQHCHWSHVL